MIKKRALLILCTMVMVLSLNFLTHNYVLSAITTFIVVMTLYIAVSYRRAYRRMGLLDCECDPEAFLKATEKQRKITGKKDTYNALFDINKAAGLICQGDYEEAKDLLEALQPDHLKPFNDGKSIYYINLMYCFYGLGAYDQAEAIFEKQMPYLVFHTKNSKKALSIFLAYRYLMLKAYDDCEEALSGIQMDQMPRRQQLEILSLKGKLALGQGKVDEARAIFHQLAQKDDALWCIKEAKDYVNQGGQMQPL